MPGLPGCELLCSCRHLSFWCPGSLAHAAHRRPACLGQHSGAMRAEHCLQPVLSKPAKRHALPRNGLGGSMRLVIASRTRATARHPTANALPGAATVHAACVSTASHTAQGAPWCEREGSPGASGARLPRLGQEIILSTGRLPAWAPQAGNLPLLHGRAGARSQQHQNCVHPDASEETRTVHMSRAPRRRHAACGKVLGASRPGAVSVQLGRSGAGSISRESSCSAKRAH